MISISDRLKLIASKIEKGETMADIGTDHGFLPLYLYETGTCPRVIMSDISRLSLEKAIDNTRRYCGSGFDDICSSDGKIDFRTGDGISVLENSEVDVVVMAGIGGNLMQEILEYDMDKSLSFSKYILQPRRHPGMIRYFLLNNGFRIKEESLVEEGKFICEIITAVPVGHVERKAPAAGPGSDEHDDITDPGCALAMDERMEHAAPDSIVWEVPPWYGRSDEALAVQYVVRKLKREEMILKSKEDSKKADLSVTKNNIMYLKSVIEELKRNCK